MVMCGQRPVTIHALLWGYRENVREIDNQSERLELIDERLRGIGTKEITDMPRVPSPDPDRYTALIYQKTEIEDELKELFEEQKETRKLVETYLATVDRADERAVIRLRYFDCLTWDEVSYAIFGGCLDYADKAESYLRRTFRLHEKAIYQLEGMNRAEQTS